MKRVIIESPYAGDIAANVEYARRCVRDSVLRGEAPIASHLLFTQLGILRDDVAEERALGIAAGLAWSLVADLHAFYIDRGFSRGMLQALGICTFSRSDFRSLGHGPVSLVRVAELVEEANAKWPELAVQPRTTERATHSHA